jgi:hypothetical protein
MVTVNTGSGSAPPPAPTTTEEVPVEPPVEPPPPPLNEQVKDAVQANDDAINEATKAAAVESKTVLPLIETRIPAPGATQHAVAFVGPDGEVLPIATQNDSGPPRGVNYPDPPKTVVEAAAAGISEQEFRAANPAAPFVGSVPIGDTSYSFASTSGGTEVTALGEEKDGPLFYNIPGTPTGSVCLTPKGVEALTAAGYIEGDPAGYSNGVPFYVLNDKAKADLAPKSVAPAATTPSQTPSTPPPTQTAPVNTQTPVGSPVSDPVTGDVTQNYSDGSKTVTHPDGSKTTTDAQGVVTEIPAP